MILRSMLGEALFSDVMEISRRNLSAALFAMTDAHQNSGQAEIRLSFAKAEYAELGGDPSNVTADWVLARHRDSLLWATVPVAVAVFDEASGYWMTDWTDPKC